MQQIHTRTIKLKCVKNNVLGHIDHGIFMSYNTEPILSVRNLKTYFFVRDGTIKAVDGVNFDVLPGQTVGIVGESGSGKSVTMRSIMQMVKKPGRIIEGEMNYRTASTQIDLAEVKPNSHKMREIRGAEIALIPQEPMASFSPLHRVGFQMIEAIQLHRPLSKEAARQEAIDMLRRVGVPAPEERIDAYSWQLSGGLRQRAMIALSLICQPSLLIADEPTTALDVTTQAQVLLLLKELQQEYGMAVILITHDLGVVAQVADYVVVMYLGRVMEQGPVEDIFYRPKHPYTQALLRSMPTVKSVSREPLPSIRGTVPSPFNRPVGCPFHPRCDHAVAGVCDTKTPELRPVGEDQFASCVLYEEQTT